MWVGKYKHLFMTLTATILIVMGCLVNHWISVIFLIIGGGTLGIVALKADHE